MKGYYFSTLEKTLRYGDGRVIEEGITHTIEGEPKLCEYGLHASKQAIDALSYAPGSYLWVVELGGTIVEGGDKCVATERTYLKGFDATELLRVFARKVALINIEKIKPYCSEDDYNLIVEFLETGDENLRSAAWFAVESAAESAAWFAARSAARSGRSAWFAAWSAARSAVRSAAETAAETAESAWFAAWFAAESVVYSKMNSMLEELIEEELKNIKQI